MVWREWGSSRQLQLDLKSRLLIAWGYSMGTVPGSLCSVTMSLCHVLHEFSWKSLCFHQQKQICIMWAARNNGLYVSPSPCWDNLWKWLCNLNTVEQIIVSAFSIKQHPYDKWNGVFVCVKYCGETKRACAKNIKRSPPNIYWYVIYITLNCGGVTH